MLASGMPVSARVGSDGPAGPRAVCGVAGLDRRSGRVTARRAPVPTFFSLTLACIPCPRRGMQRAAPTSPSHVRHNPRFPPLLSWLNQAKWGNFDVVAIYFGDNGYFECPNCKKV